MDSLSTNGYFYDTVEKEVESLFLPWLTSEVDKSLEKMKLAQKCVDGNTQNILFKRFLIMRVFVYFFRCYLSSCEKNEGVQVSKRENGTISA
jgi:hypothetical protein